MKSHDSIETPSAKTIGIVDPAAIAPEPVHRIHSIAIHQLVPTRDNPRKIRPNDPALKELTESVRSLGILQPLIARPMPPATLPTGWPKAVIAAHKRGEAIYDLRAGHRRLAAAEAVGLELVPVVVREMDDKTAMEITVSENLQRENLTPLEESEGVQHLLDVGWDVQAIADRLGKTASWVARRAKLRDLNELWRRAIEEREDLARWPATVLELVARLPSATQDLLFTELIGSWQPGQKRPQWSPDVDVPTAREVEQEIDYLLQSIKAAPWKLDDESLVPEAGRCTACPKRSAAQPLLWGDAEGNGKKGTDRCLDRTCYERKLQAHIARKTDDLKAQGHTPIGLVEAYSPAEQLAPVRGELKPVKKYDVSEAKKSDAHAVPAIVLDGAHAGTVRWVKPSRSASAKSTGIEREKGKPTPLAERRKMLDRRRIAHIITAIREKLDRITDGKEDLPERVADNEIVAIGLAVAFGTSETHRFFDSMAPWKQLDKRVVGVHLAMLANELVLSVLPVLESRLLYHNGEDAERRRGEAKRTAELLALRWQDLEAAAAQAIPEPKGWASLKADGTPKKPAAKRNDPTLTNATRFYRKNRKAMDAEAEVASGAARTKKTAEPEASSTSASETSPPAKKRARAKAKKRTKKGKKTSRSANPGRKKSTAEKVRTCRECGCTDEYGCDGGCEWVEPDLCSACTEGQSAE